MNTKGCFFLGVPGVSPSVYPQLAAAAEQMITRHGVTAFYVHLLTDFDDIAAGAVRNLKWRYPQVTLTLVQTDLAGAYMPAALFDAVFSPPKAEDDIWGTYAVRGDFCMLEYCEFLIACVDAQTRQLLSRFVATRSKKKPLYIKYLEFKE